MRSGWMKSKASQPRKSCATSSPCRKFRACAEREDNDEIRMTKFQHALEDEGSFWLDDATPLVREEPNTKPVYDLEERTARFGEAVIDFAKSIPHGPTTDRIISQLISAATSVGANYVEADDSVSKKEFLKCIGACKKKRHEKRNIFCVWPFAPSQHLKPTQESCGWKRGNYT
jgi:23S rRNA-intervening sequence protein